MTKGEIRPIPDDPGIKFLSWGSSPENAKIGEVYLTEDPSTRYTYIWSIEQGAWCRLELTYVPKDVDMGIKVFRIKVQDEVVGGIAAKSEEAAQAFAQGKYGASAEVSRVGIQMALSSSPICEIFSTDIIHTSDLSSGRTIRVIGS